MPDDKKEITFNSDKFLDDLINEMGLLEALPNEIETLKTAMLEQLNQVIMTAVSIFIEDEAIDYVMKKHADLKDSDQIFAALVANSPQSQIAILDAMELFKENTLDAHKDLVKAA